MEIAFRIVQHSNSRKAGEDEKHRVSMKSSEGHRLVLVGDDDSIQRGFPLGETIMVSIKEYATLDTFDQKGQEKEEG